MSTQFLRVSDCARITNTSEALWRKKILHKEIPVTKVGRSVRIAAEDLEKHLVSRRRAAASEGEPVQ